ncbi:MAG: four helix bundle protein [Saprospiraceae bacterium]|nr:four helix bundle protein [Saprospiraceae bacterium]
MIDFKNLLIWQKSHQLTLNIYSITTEFPSFEKYGLTNQMRRSASSIPANISEGCGRNSDKELKRFLSIAMGSAAELEYQILLAKDLMYISDEVYEDLTLLIIEIRKMINSFIEKLNFRITNN